MFESFRDLDWKPVAVEIEALEREKRELEDGSDVLRILHGQLSAIEDAIGKTDTDLKKVSDERVGARSVEIKPQSFSTIAGLNSPRWRTGPDQNCSPG